MPIKKFTKAHMDNLLKLFTVPEGYEKNSFYGAGMYPRKKDNMFVISLYYDYKKRPVMSSSIDVKELSDAMDIIACVNQFAQDGSKKEVVADVSFLSNPDCEDVVEEEPVVEDTDSVEGVTETNTASIPKRTLLTGDAPQWGGK